MSIRETLSTRNLSIYAIGAQFALIYVPHVFLQVVGFRNGQWDNKAPRLNVDRASGEKKMSSKEIAKFQRASSAEANGHEILPLFVASVLAANMYGVKTYTINKWSLIFLLIRGIYNPLYIFGYNDTIAATRSTVWSAGVLVCFNLLRHAGANAFRISNKVAEVFVLEG